jgi:hypothetical protein
VAGRGLYALLSNIHSEETPPYTLPREGIAHPPLFNYGLIMEYIDTEIKSTSGETNEHTISRYTKPKLAV